MKRAITALLFLATVGAGQDVDFLKKYLSFISYKNIFKKRYSTPQEEKYRQAVYQLNLYQYEMINTNKSNTYKAGITPLSDLTLQEFTSIYLNLKLPLIINGAADSTSSPIDMSKVSIDWVKNNKSTIPKDQGVCGTSWAYAAVALVESAFVSQSFLKPNFSEQQLIDCAVPNGSHCEGESLFIALEYIQTQGITEEGLYPITIANQKQPCRDEIKGIFKITETSITFGCSSLVSSLERSPAAVTVDATNWAPYVSGVLNNCGSIPNYAAVVVGATDDYWKVKCAWGGNWGEAGYIRVTTGNSCGICNNIIDVFL